MGASFGAGILASIRANELDDAGRVEFLREFAAEGHSEGFREVLDDRVLELKYKEGHVDCRYLDEASAAPIIAAAKRIGGSAPSSQFPICLPAAIMIPGYRGNGARKVKLPAGRGGGGGFAISPLRNCIERLRAFINLDDESEFARKLLEQMETCREFGLIFNCGD